jgi:hypothetical protein
MAFLLFAYFLGMLPVTDEMVRNYLNHHFELNRDDFLKRKD